MGTGEIDRVIGRDEHLSKSLTNEYFVNVRVRRKLFLRESYILTKGTPYLRHTLSFSSYYIWLLAKT